jgi:hypothetical protein
MDCEKITYGSYNEAQEAIVHLSRTQRKSMRVYKCTGCGGLHITTIHVRKLKMGKGYKKEKYPIKMDLKPIHGKREPKTKKEPFQEKPQIPSRYKLLSREMAEQLKQKLNLDTTGTGKVQTNNTDHQRN